MNMFDKSGLQRPDSASAAAPAHVNMFARAATSDQTPAHVNMFVRAEADKAKNSSPRISSDYNKLFGTALDPNPLKTDTAQMNQVVATARQLPKAQPQPMQTQLADDHAFRQKAINDPNTNFLLKKWLQVIDPVVSNPTYDKFSQRSGAAASSAMGGNQIQAPSTGNVFADAGADALGMVGGIMAAPGAGQAMGVENVLGGLASKYAPTIGRLAPKLVGTTAGKLVGRALQGAGGGAAYEGTLGVVNDQSPADIAKRMGTGAATFGVLKGAGALGKIPAALAGAGVFGGQALAQGATPQQALAQGLFGGAMGSMGGESGKARASLEAGKLSKIETPITPTAKTYGTLTPKNTAYGKAVSEYNMAIEQVQNHFGTNELRTNEMARIKPELGIDLNQLVNNIQSAESGVNLGQMGSRGRMSLTAGVNDIPTLRKPEFAPKVNIPVPFLQPNLGANGGVKPPSLTPRGGLLSQSAIPSGNLGTGLKERQFAQNVQGASITPADIKQNLKDNALTYEPITNKQTFDKATQLVNADPVQAQNYFDSPSKGVSADDVALGEALITKAIKEGNTPEANRLIADLAEKLTTAGQAVQAAKVFKKMSPEGMLLYAHRVVNTVNKNILEESGAKAPKVELTPEESQYIIETMQRAQKLPEGSRERDIAEAQVKKLISDKIPPTWADRIKALQRISMLLNSKTMVRNFLGNTIFGTIDNVSNIVATPIDKLTSKLLKTDRTTTLPSITGQLKSMGEGMKLTAQDAKLGIDTYNTKTQYEFSSKKNFTGKNIVGKALNKLDRATIVGLKMGDTPFHKAAFDDSLRQQMKLAKVDKPTTAMEEQAQKTADQRTYQDANALTVAFKKAQSALNLGKDFGLGNIALPFVKTPASLLARAADYSPVGVIKAFKEATNISNGTFDQKTFVDSISRAVTGTALIMVGYDLAKQGKITGSGNKDKDLAAFERGLGKNDFAYKVGDKYYEYSWAQPASMALAIGADIYLKGKDRKQAENVVIDAVKSGGETLFKLTLLQGVQRFMGGFSPMDNIATTIINAPSQFAPTLGKQITQLTDPIQRSTYSPSNLGTGTNLIKAKIPGVNKSLEPKIDTFGNTVKNFQGNNSLFNIFVNPGNSTEFKPNKVQKEILRLYDATGDKTIFPKVAPKSFTQKGQRYDLTPQEVTTYQQIMGKNTEARMSTIVTYPYPDEVKVKTLERAIKLSEEDARKAILRERKAGN